MMIRSPHVRFVAALVVVAAAPIVEAQWSTDPAAPLVIADRSGPQVQPKIAATPDGGVYVSWFDSSTGGYDVYLQRLDSLGYEQWPHNGVLVADRGFSSTQDYGLSIDTAGNALLAFRDDRGPTTEITVSMIAPDGSLLWGSDGVQVSSGGAFVASPRVAGTDDGNVVVAWTKDSSVKIQKLDPTGSPQWGVGVTLAPGAGSFGAADLHESGSGTAIVSFTHMTGSFPSPIHLSAQKLSAAGNLLWGAGHVQVYDQAGGSLQIGNFPPFVPDGAGGAVFAWYTSSPSLQCRVQRVLSGGSLAFTPQGIEVSTEASRIRVSPSAIFDGATQEIIVAWREQDPGQTQSGLYAQKIDASGARQWTDSGREIRPLGTDEITNVTTLPHEDQALLAWVQSPSFGNDPIYATRITSGGVAGWMPDTVALGSLPSNSSDLVGDLGSPGYAAYAWSDGGTSDGDILIANLLGDGSLGYTGEIFSDGFEVGDTRWWSLTVP
jgi:hypothetical protein